jgi:hypothetical protein
MPKVKKLMPKVEPKVQSVQQIIIPEGAAQLVQMASVAAAAAAVSNPTVKVSTTVPNLFHTNGTYLSNGTGNTVRRQENGIAITNGLTTHLNGVVQKRPFQIAQIQTPNHHVIKSPLLSTQVYTSVSAPIANGNAASNSINGSSTNIQPTILKSKINQSNEQTPAQPLANSTNSGSQVFSGNSTASSEDQFNDFTLLASAAVNSANSNTGSFDSGTFHTPSKRRKHDTKNGKGLRHFSMKVCEKVKLKGVTTYNEVADELVAEFTADPSQISPTPGGDSFQNGDSEPFDQKNIRRRVYDALNVLMAMNIISKEKKEIRWIGLPSNSTQECYDLEQEKQDRLRRIKMKKQQLRDLLLQQIAFKNLVERNKRFSQAPSQNAIIKLPFIIVNTDKKTVIDCSISNDKSEYLFNFDNTFEIHDDIEVLKRIGFTCGLDKTSGPSDFDRRELEKARAQLPEALRSELDEMLDEKPHASDLTNQLNSTEHSELVINSELESSSFFSMQSAP